MPKSIKAPPAAVASRLTVAMPAPKCELDHHNAWQLLMATILSAQSTDKTINRITPALFARYPDAHALAQAPQEDVEELVKASGFFRNKAKAIRAASAVLVEKHGGQVPQDMDALQECPGVARKTANMVLGTVFRLPTGMVVDTHVGRVARRLGLTTQEDAGKVEADLCAAFPKEQWVDMGHRLVLHGRYMCVAKKPQCARCPLEEICPSSEAKAGEGPWEDRATLEGALVARRGES
jgi:endonuclease-3